MKKKFIPKWTIGDHKVFLKEEKEIIRKKDSVHSKVSSSKTIIDVKSETDEAYIINVKYRNPSYTLTWYAYKNIANVLPEIEYLNFELAFNKNDYSLKLLNRKAVSKEYKQSIRKIENYFFSEIKYKDEKLAPVGRILYSYISIPINTIKYGFNTKKGIEEFIVAEMDVFFNSYGEFFVINKEEKNEKYLPYKKNPNKLVKVVESVKKSEIDDGNMYYSLVEAVHFVVDKDDKEGKDPTSGFYTKNIDLKQLDFGSSWMVNYGSKIEANYKDKLVEYKSIVISLQE
ncbi:hypothetical protein ABW636_15460 [Aquimarina sp. 2201CG1-2-11]|uniref:hypothetical protein n=1 Tax=Aquimarina discodermiae TaxID=3231043 RepID=UPI0034629989